MPKDKRYKALRIMIEGGHITTFREIFDTIPKSVIAADLGFNNTRMNKVLDNVDRFIIRDLFKIASLIGVEEIMIMQLVCNEYVAVKKSKRPK